MFFVFVFNQDMLRLLLYVLSLYLYLYVMDDHYLLYFAPALRFLRSQTVCRPAIVKSFGWDYKPRSPVWIRMQKDHTSTLNILLFMSEFGGLWKYNNPACSKSVRSLHSVKLDTKEGGTPSSEMSSDCMCGCLCACVCRSARVFVWSACACRCARVGVCVKLLLKFRVLVYIFDLTVVTRSLLSEGNCSSLVVRACLASVLCQCRVCPCLLSQCALSVQSMSVPA